MSRCRHAKPSTTARAGSYSGSVHAIMHVIRSSSRPLFSSKWKCPIAAPMFTSAHSPSSFLLWSDAATVAARKIRNLRTYRVIGSISLTKYLVPLSSSLGEGEVELNLESNVCTLHDPGACTHDPIAPSKSYLVSLPIWKHLDLHPTLYRRPSQFDTQLTKSP